MTEKQRLAAGLKAAPTKRQMTHLNTGCCYDCAYVMGMKGIPQMRLILPALIITALFVLVIFLIGSRFT